MGKNYERLLKTDLGFDSDPFQVEKDPRFHKKLKKQIRFGLKSNKYKWVCLALQFRAIERQIERGAKNYLTLPPTQ